MSRNQRINIKRILITGVAGFIGSNLADRLLRTEDATYELIGIDNLSYGVKEQIPEGINFHQTDIRSEDIYPIFKGVDAVFHFAAKNCINDCQKEPVQAADINVGGTVNVFEAARRSRVKKVIYAESSAVYENSNVYPTPESEVKPESFYAISKAATSLFAKAYQRYFGICLTALRYFCVYGPRQDYRRVIPPVMSSFIIKLLRGERPIIYGNGSKRRDFIHIDDVNEFHLMCLNDKKTDGNTYNIGSGKNYSIQDIYQNTSAILNIHIPPEFVDDLPGEARETLADIHLAREIGWEPKVEIKEGLKGMIDYIKHEMKSRKT